MDYQLVCRAEDFVAETRACSAPVWEQQTGMLPPLSAEDGAAIGAAIVGVWICGAAVRWARSALD